MNKNSDEEVIPEMAGQELKSHLRTENCFQHTTTYSSSSEERKRAASESSTDLPTETEDEQTQDQKRSEKIQSEAAEQKFLDTLEKMNADMERYHNDYRDFKERVLALIEQSLIPQSPE